MKALVYHRCGGPEVMSIADIPIPKPGGGQVLVRVKAASLNPVDLKMRSIMARFIPGNRFPRQMGIDYAGVVEAIGPGVSGFTAGDEIFGWADFKTTGTFAEYVATDANLAVHKPGTLLFTQAACLGIAGSTVLKAFFEKGNLQTGMQVLVNGCMGGVGHMAVQIAVGHGATVTGVCGAYDMDAAQQLGCNQVFDYRASVPKQWGGPFDMVLDTPGVLGFNRNIALLKPGGLYIHLVPTRSMVQAILSSLVMNKSYTVFNTLGKRERLLRLAALAESGVINPAIGKTIPLQSAVEGITKLEAGERVRGKAVIVMD